MGDMADFIGFNSPDPCEDEEIKFKLYNVENLLCYKDETIYKECKQIEIKDDYEYKDLCENILKYYEKHKKLSERQRVALCCLLTEEGFCELEGE